MRKSVANPMTVEMASQAMTNMDLDQKGRQIRATCIQMAHDAKESHVKGALSCVDILVTLFNGVLKYDVENFANAPRDRFIFSKGHAASALYATLADVGIIPKTLLKSYGQSNSPLPSHPCKHMLKVLDWSSGSLGHGLGVGTGMAYALKLNHSSSRVFVLLSDGECNEGSTWEAAQFARANKLDNLVAIVDYNGSQSIGYTEDILGQANIAEKFRAFGWTTLECDGHSYSDLYEAFQPTNINKDRPTVIVAHTDPGNGLDILDDHILWHYRTPSSQEVLSAMQQLDCNSIVEEL